MPSEYVTPQPNAAADREARNQRLADRLKNNSDDIREAFLVTLDSGGTKWVIVYRDGTTTHATN